MVVRTITPEPEGIWKYSKPIMGILLGLFVVAIGVDAVLWYKVQKNSTDQQTLNEIIASKQGPQTDEDKTKLLDALATAHAGAGATQTTGQPPKKTSSPNPAPTSPSDQTKIDLLNSLHKK